MALLAACAPAPSGPAALAADAPAPGLAPALAGTRGAAGVAHSIARLGGSAIAAYPDRGDLVGYDKVRAVQRRGANTFYPVRVSEAHALDAIGSGTLLLTGPDGGHVRLQYEHHVEHPSGDWSWIGRDEHGIEGILTFGEKAVFGVMPYGEGTSLRLTTSGGQAWMSTTAPGVLSPLDQRRRAGITGPDFRIPGPLDDTPGVQPAAAPAVGHAAAPAQAAAAAAAAGTTVDLLLGYTPGFASMLGGASQAQTRLNHLVTVGNQTLANSDVAASFRLVGTLQVDYPDTGSNKTALEQLTGSTGSANVPVPASLQPLRAARETYGADLVSLVRRFRDAEHDGCGIAWLVGGGQVTITPGYEKFGYSAISDSNGMGAPDNGHYCRDETLVHEIGHNMGSQHDDEAARDDDGELEYGRFPYSFGYKTTAAAGNFYTVMAYGDAGQTAWRIFSNPQSTYCGGRPCGVANQADNARSLRATVPLIAAFRETTVQPPTPPPPPSAPRAAVGGTFDVNGDGRADLLWRHGTNGGNALWLGADVARPQAIGGVPAAAWTVAGVGDFNGDGRSDILWRHSVTGQNTIWVNGNSASSMAVGAVPNLAWRVAAVGDFNGDGRDDIVWRHSGSGANSLWYSANVATSTQLATVADQRWMAAAVGDFDGDGRDDILWRHAATGSNNIWLRANNATSVAIARVADVRWKIAAAGDFDGDGITDLMWRQDETGLNSVWRRANVDSSYAIARVADGSWIVEAAGDYNGDGYADLFWRHAGNGNNSIWRSAAAVTSYTVPRVADLAWDVKP
ncbi:FG-GAP-like repeat-containing protein [Luteimonas sp. MJ204]|uniref:FG-GAP-like repeat-containing protein n=1 Tax=Luteimonas sp. MJ145 TaxID=3129234 RepID=UPI0031BAED85